jgi:hypothetical protein
MKTSVLFLICFSLTSIISFSQPHAEKFETIRSFKTHEVRQGVAVDKKFFYSVNTKGIGQ